MIMPGDVVSVDCGAIIDGWHGDAAFTVIVDPVDSDQQKMLDVCEESMWVGIAAGVAGAKLSDIGHAIESYVNSQGKYGILREYGGHGIGTAMHMEPHILNYGKPGNGPTIEVGMVFAIEPMITMGSERTRVLEDNWTVVTVDKSRGSHFENSYCIAPDGKPFVLTSTDGGKGELARFGIEVSEVIS
jgi:methionyl aminopeptidase